MQTEQELIEKITNDINYHFKLKNLNIILNKPIEHDLFYTDIIFKLDTSMDDIGCVDIIPPTKVSKISLDFRMFNDFKLILYNQKNEKFCFIVDFGFSSYNNRYYILTKYMDNFSRFKTFADSKFLGKRKSILKEMRETRDKYISDFKESSNKIIKELQTFKLK